MLFRTVFNMCLIYRYFTYFQDDTELTKVQITEKKNTFEFLPTIFSSIFFLKQNWNLRRGPDIYSNTLIVMRMCYILWFSSHDQAN